MSRRDCFCGKLRSLRELNVTNISGFFRINPPLTISIYPHMSQITQTSARTKELRLMYYVDRLAYKWELVRVRRLHCLFSERIHIVPNNLKAQLALTLQLVHFPRLVCTVCRHWTLYTFTQFCGPFVITQIEMLVSTQLKQMTLNRAFSWSELPTITNRDLD